MLPGVASDGDMSALLYVRGGDADEVVSIVDGMIIMNPYAWGGRISLLNPNLIDEIQFYGGGFPAEVNQAMSAYLDVKNKVGNPEKFSGLIDISAATADLFAEGPCPGPKGSSFLVGIRRTSFDLWMSTPDSVFPYFYDGQAKLNFPLPSGTLTVQSLFGVEGMDYKFTEESGFEGGHSKEARSTYILRKTNSSVGYDHRFSDAVQVFTLLGLRYDTGTYNFQDYYAPMRMDLVQGLLQLRHIWTFLPNDRNVVKAGLYAITGDGTADYFADIRTPTGNNNYFVQHYEKRLEFEWPVFTGLFVQDDIEVAKDFLYVNPGVNAQYFSGNKQWIANPRLSIKAKLQPDLEVHAATGLYSQHPMEYDLIDADYGNPGLQAKEAIHYILGSKWELDEDYFFQVEAFYKDYRKLFVSDPDPKINYTNNGVGHAAGFDVILQKKLGGNWDGWLSYSYVVSRRMITSRSNPEDFGQNPALEPVGEWTTAPTDRTHSLNLVLNYIFNPQWKLAFTQKYMTGKPYTPVVDSAYQPAIDEYVPIYGSYNSDRYPAFASTDIKLTMPGFGLKGLSSYVQVSNLFDVKNVESYAYNKDYSSRKAMTQFGQMIYGGLKYKF